MEFHGVASVSEAKGVVGKGNGRKARGRVQLGTSRGESRCVCEDVRVSGTVVIREEPGSAHTPVPVALQRERR